MKSDRRYGDYIVLLLVNLLIWGFISLGSLNVSGCDLFFLILLLLLLMFMVVSLFACASVSLCVYAGSFRLMNLRCVSLPSSVCVYTYM